MITTRQQRGFSLVELAIVLLIMAIILGGLVAPLAAQRESERANDARDQLRDVEKAIYGFAAVNGFIPCPATPASNGYAAASGAGCSAQHGFVPATTLNLSGTRNDDNLLLDPWGSPLRYSVTAADSNANGRWDFTTPGEMQSVSMALLTPDLVVCSTAAGSSATACSDPGTTLAEQSPAIVYSLGRDWPSFNSADQRENVGATIAGGASGQPYRVADDSVFVQRGRSDRNGDEYDDLLLWLSAQSLYSRLVETGHLP
ncbi:MAG: type II secretion system protein [Woeseiaceae bacterium]|nr:type II secretion system protein [Woeseiaceae bacterium]